MQVVTRLEVGFLMAFFIDALVISADAGHAVAVEEQFRAGESREYGDPGSFHFAAQPLNKPVERNDVVPVIAQGRGSDGKLKLAFLSEEVDRFFGHFGVERSLFFKAREQFAHRSWIEQRTG